MVCRLGDVCARANPRRAQHVLTASTRHDRSAASEPRLRCPGGRVQMARKLRPVFAHKKTGGEHARFVASICRGRCGGLRGLAVVRLRRWIVRRRHAEPAAGAHHRQPGGRRHLPGRRHAELQRQRDRPRGRQPAGQRPHLVGRAAPRQPHPSVPAADQRAAAAACRSRCAARPRTTSSTASTCAPPTAPAASSRRHATCCRARRS